MVLKKAFLAVIRQRKFLLMEQKNLKDEQLMKVLVAKFEKHLKIYSKIKEESLIKYLQKNWANLEAIVTGNKAGASQIEKIRQIVWQ